MNKVSVDYLNGGRRITVRIGRFLDCSAHSAFLVACELADELDIRSIVVDLNATEDIRASGLGTLLNLRNDVEPLGTEVALENCSPELQRQIDASRLLAGIPHTAYSPGNLEPEGINLFWAACSKIIRISRARQQRESGSSHGRPHRQSRRGP